MPLSVYIIVLAELLVVSFIDFKTRKISNRWSLLNVAFYLLLLIFFKEAYSFSWESIFYSLSFFFAGFALFISKIMGGGDAKLLASLYLLIPPRLQEDSFLYLIYSTLLIGGGILIYKLWINREMLKVALYTQDYAQFKGIMGKKFPFSPVILLAWITWGIFHFLKIF